LENKKLSFLDDIRPEDSGLINFVRDKFQEKLKEEINKRAKLKSEFVNTDFVKLLAKFLTGRFQELDEMFLEHPELIISKGIKALKILNSLHLEQNIKPESIFPFKSQDSIVSKKLANNLAATLVEIYFMIKDHTKLLNESSIDLWKLEEIFPEIFYFLSKTILIKNQKAYFEKIETKLQLYLENLAEYNEDDSEEIKELKFTEKLKLKYLRLLLLSRQNKEEELQEALLEYHNLYKPNPDKAPKLINLKPESHFKSSDILNHWSEILEESDTLQSEAEKLSLIYSKTCEYFSCSDCCSNTFPTMGLTEYLYLKDWMQKNNFDEKTILEKSKAIQNDYEAKFSDSLSLIDKSKIENQIRGVENPHNYKFRCPFLTDDSKCSCHPARPILCRGFGSASNNGVSIKTCNFYLKQYQHNSSPENERYVLDLQGLETLMRASDQFQANLKGIEMKEPRGTIVAWFSQDSY
jgi:Fe-S-cluster containining protein